MNLRGKNKEADKNSMEFRDLKDEDGDNDSDAGSHSSHDVFNKQSFPPKDNYMSWNERPLHKSRQLESLAKIK